MKKNYQSPLILSYEFEDVIATSGEGESLYSAENGKDDVLIWDFHVAD